MLPPCTVALARRARTASQASASPANTDPCSTSDCGCRTPSRIAPDSTTVMPSTGSAAASQARRTGWWASARPTSPASRPASHGSTSSGPSPSTGGSVVSRSFQPKTAWSATRASVDGPGQHGGVAQRAQAQRAPEEEEHHQADHHRGDDRPPGCAGQVGDRDGDDRTQHPDDEVARAGERGAEGGQRDRGEREGERDVGPGVPVGQQRVRTHARAGAGRRAMPRLIARSTAAGRRGLPWRRGGARAGRRCR